MRDAILRPTDVHLFRARRQAGCDRLYPAERQATALQVLGTVLQTDRNAVKCKSDEKFLNFLIFWPRVGHGFPGDAFLSTARCAGSITGLLDWQQDEKKRNQ